MSNKNIDLTSDEIAFLEILLIKHKHALEMYRNQPYTDIIRIEKELTYIKDIMEKIA